MAVLRNILLRSEYKLRLVQNSTVVYMFTLILAVLYYCICVVHPVIHNTDHDVIVNSIYLIFLITNIIGDYVLGVKNTNIYKSGKNTEYIDTVNSTLSGISAFILWSNYSSHLSPVLH